MCWLFSLNQNWSFLPDSEWLNLPAANIIVLLQFPYHEAIVTKKLTLKSVCISEDIGKVIADCIDDKTTKYQ